MTTDSMVTDAPQEVDWKLELAQKRFLYKVTDEGVKKDALKQDVLSTVYAKEGGPLYQQVCEELGWAVEQQKLEELQLQNENRLKEMEDKIKDAEENLGETEVREALLAKAEYLCQIGEREKAIEAYATTEAKTAGSGPKLDIVFSILRLDLSRSDWHSVKKDIEKAKKLCEEGGDWERKNRLKVYEALFLLSIRQFSGAAELFLDSIATFTTNELFSYEKCVFYTVIMAVLSLDRVSLKTKVIDSPEVLSVIDSIPHVGPFVNSLYLCKYKDFFTAFAGLVDDLQSDRYISPHFRFYMRELRVVAYSQFLDAYKSVTLASMANSFGLSVDFLDRELADFIVAGRLTAKIDKVAGVIETNRPDAKNAQYQQTIKQGDLLLNRLQKLSKVIDLE